MINLLSEDENVPSWGGGPTCGSEETCLIVNELLDYSAQELKDMEENRKISDRIGRANRLREFIFYYKGASETEILVAINKILKINGKES